MFATAARADSQNLNSRCAQNLPEPDKIYDAIGHYIHMIDTFAEPIFRALFSWKILRGYHQNQVRIHSAQGDSSLLTYLIILRRDIVNKKHITGLSQRFCRIHSKEITIMTNGIIGRH